MWSSTTKRGRSRRSFPLLAVLIAAALLGSCRSPARGARSMESSRVIARSEGSGHAGRVTLSALTVDTGPVGSELSRVVVAFDGPTESELVEGPSGPDGRRRVWLVTHGARLADSLGLPRAVGGPVLRSIDWDGERLAFELAPGVEVSSFVLGQPSRWVLDFRRTSAVSTVDATKPVRLVLLDPGHGGFGQGAAVGGLREADLVLDIAKRVSALLIQRLPGVRVLLTRSEDVAVSLDDRTAMANAVGADLFVSIHLNDAPVPIEHGGVTTFVLDTRDVRQEVRFAARENGTSEAEVTGMQRILADLHRDGQLERSRRVAELVQSETVRQGRAILPGLHDRGVERQVFSVLVGARMPAILVEASFMTRPEELAALRTDAYRQALAEGIARGIIRYAAAGVGSGTFLAAR